MKRHLLLVFFLVGCGAVKADSDAGAGGPDATPIPGSCADDPCDTNATCSEASGAVVCTCDEGYTGDGLDCDDVNECATDNGGCHELANCINQPGMRACVCPPGHVGDGITACTPTWSEVVAWDVGPGDWFHVAGVGARVYLMGREGAPDRFFKSIDVQTGTERNEPLPPQLNDFNGHQQPFVTSGSYIYMLRQWGQLYDTTSQVWNELTVPPERQRYDAAVGMVGSRIHSIGGAGYTTPDFTEYYQYNITNNAFDVTTGGWGSYATYPEAITGARATTLDGNLFVAGGQSSSGVETMSFHVFSAGGWGALPALPEMYLRDLLGWNGKIWALYGDRVRVFDVSSTTWESTFIPLPNGADAWQARLVVVNGAPHFVHRDGTTLRVWRFNL